jgi:anti-sigma B factor antagonist
MPGAGYPIEMVRGVPVVAAPGEIDVSNAGWLRAVLLDAACRGHATYVVDMTRTRICTAAGLSVLVRAHKRALAEGGELRLAIPAAALLGVFAITGLDRLIPIFTDLDQALEPGPTPVPPPSATAPATAPHAWDAPPADRPAPDRGAATSPA